HGGLGRQHDQPTNDQDPYSCSSRGADDCLLNHGSNILRVARNECLAWCAAGACKVSSCEKLVNLTRAWKSCPPCISLDFLAPRARVICASARCVISGGIFYHLIHQAKERT